MWRPIQAPSGQVTGTVSLRHITGYTTKDKQNAAIRAYLASNADFVGAVRLPSDAFKREGTSVVTDILFLRKRAQGEGVNHTFAGWLETGFLQIEEVEVSVNRYFLSHPEMVLGVWSRHNTLYGEGYSVTGKGDLPTLLHEAVGKLPRFPPFRLTSRESSTNRPSALPPVERHYSEGSFLVRDDRTICQVVGGGVQPVRYGWFGGGCDLKEVLSGRRSPGRESGRPLWKEFRSNPTRVIGVGDSARRLAVPCGSSGHFGRDTRSLRAAQFYPTGGRRA
jgi:hypothetical protein